MQVNSRFMTALLRQRIQAIERPDSALCRYYVLLPSGLSPLFRGRYHRDYFRYHTIRLVQRRRHFDDLGILCCVATTIRKLRAHPGHSSQVQHRRTLLGLCRILNPDRVGKPVLRN